MATDAEKIATLEAQLTALKKARASGALSVRHGDTSVQYRSIAEIKSAISAVSRELRALRGGSRKPRYVLQTTKGL